MAFFPQINLLARLTARFQDAQAADAIDLTGDDEAVPRGLLVDIFSAPCRPTYEDGRLELPDAIALHLAAMLKPDASKKWGDVDAVRRAMADVGRSLSRVCCCSDDLCDLLDIFGHGDERADQIFEAYRETMDHYIKRESPPAFDAPPSAPSAPSAPVEALADAALLPAPVEALAAMAAAPAPPATNDVQFLAQAVAGLFFVTDFAYMSMTGGFESMRLKLTDVQATLDMHLRIRYLDTELFATMRTELVTHRLLIATLFALVFALWYNPSTPI